MVQEVAANVGAFGVGKEPIFEGDDAGEIGAANPVAEGLLHFLLIFSGANLKLEAGGGDEVEFGVEVFAFQGFPFAAVEPDAAGGGTEINFKFEAVPDFVANEQASAFRAHEGATLGIIGGRGRGRGER